MRRGRTMMGSVAIAGAVALAGALVATANARPLRSAAQEPDPAQQRAEQLVAQMTLDEKISQTFTGALRTVPGIPRLGIPDFRITNGPAGVGPGSIDPQESATALPSPESLAASFDPALAREYGAVEGRETRDVGHSLIEAPDVNIVRVPVAGRVFETYGEDPYLAGKLAAANVRGIQGQGVLAEVKHYVANNAETDRLTINEKIDERTLREIYLPAFEQTVKDANPASVMCAYPSVNDQFMCQNKGLLGDVLRDQWGFKGFVQSDWGANHSAVDSVRAGTDLELSGGGFGGAAYAQGLKQAVLGGKVAEKDVDRLVVRRLAVEIRSGVLDRPAGKTPIDAAAGGAVARSAAEQGTVLLKNAGSQLPLSAGTTHSIAVIGPYAQQAHPGGGGSSHVNPLYTVNPVQGIQNRVGPGVTVRSSDGSDAAQAARLAESSDVAVVVVGNQATEGKDASSLALLGDQDALVRSVAAANPHTVVVLNTGGAALMPWAQQVPSIVETWYPGEEDGNALAAVLFGDVNPSGKLPVTFPAADQQVPASTPAQYPGVNGTAVYSEGLRVGYRWYDATMQRPLFPFGHGLSYTTFNYSDLRVTPRPDGEGKVRVTATVTNSGTRAGSDVAQVYLQFPAAANEPPRQLKGFEKVELRPGERRQLQFTLDERAFSTWSGEKHDWTSADGEYTVHVGDSSADLPLSAPVIVHGRG